jgi:hypothetical protein
MWRVYKIWGAGKKNIYLSSAKKNYRQLASLSSVKKNTKACLPSVKKKHSPNKQIFRVFFLLSVVCATLIKKVVGRVHEGLHSENRISFCEIFRSDCKKN